MAYPCCSPRFRFLRAFSTLNLARGCNSYFAQYSKTPKLNHSAWPDSRTRTERLVEAKRIFSLYVGLQDSPLGYICDSASRLKPLVGRVWVISQR
jgi:hypothetical protein